MTDLGPLKTFLRIEIRRSRRNRCLHLSQARYINMILERHGRTDSAPISTPADPHVRLLKSSPEQQADANNPQRYQSAVGLLMYAMVGSTPDIAFPVLAVSQHSTNPGPSHWTAIRRIFRYLARTQTWGLNYQVGHCGGYTDADWGGGEDRRLISGYAFMVNGAVVAWASKKQPSIALSSTEGESIALTQGVKESLWLGGLRQDHGALNHQHQVKILNCDNQGAIALTKNPKYHARTKHIDIQFHFIRQNISKNNTLRSMHSVRLTHLTPQR